MPDTDKGYNIMDVIYKMLSFIDKNQKNRKLRNCQIQRCVRYLLFLLFAFMSNYALCQQRHYYEGGFFEKKGKIWYEYKDTNPQKPVNWFTEAYDNDNFYVGDNGNCKIAIPKDTKNNFLLQYKNSKEWVFKYRSKAVRKKNEYTSNSCSGKIKSVSVNKQSNGVVISVGFTINDFKDETGTVCAYFYSKDGDKILAGTSSFSTSDNQFAKSERYTPIYKDTAYNDFKILIPWSEMHKAKMPNSAFKIKVVLRGRNQTLDYRFSQDFLFTDISYNCICGSQRKCPLCFGTGYLMGVVQCSSCYGTGKCTNCHGEGIIYCCSIIPAGQTNPPASYVQPRMSDINTSTSVPDRTSGVQTYNEKCTFCNGTGRNPLCDFPPEYTSKIETYRYCEVCKATLKYHTHGSCPSCLGKGYTQRMKYLK